MHRKDFEMLARVVRMLEIPPMYRTVVAKDLARELKNHFSSFNHDKFLEECQLN